MRSVLTAVDYIKDIDGSFKVLELNTGLSIIPRTIEPYFNKVDFDNLLSQNNITTIDFIGLSLGFEDINDLEVINGQNEGMVAFLKRTYPNLEINIILVSPSGWVTPILNDSPNKLIIRQSYDSSALIDETYAKDNFEFLKLLYDNDINSIPKTYFNHPTLGFDSIGTNIRDNGNYPNFIIKQRYPITNYEIYPKPVKITTQQELTDLKNSISNDLILQEYIINFNDLENGKLKTYRTIGLIYGSNIDSVNLFEPFIHTNPCSIDLDVDYYDNEIQVWERPKYIQKYKTRHILTYNSDSSNLIIKSDGSLVTPDNLSINDSIKSVNLFNLPDTDDPRKIFLYKELQDNVFSGSTFSNTTIESISNISMGVWIRNLFLDGGLKFSDVGHSLVLILRDGFIKFSSFQNIELTDQIVVVDNTNNQFILKGIISESFIFTKEKIFTIDVEDIDTYLTMEESTTTPKYFIIQHNGAPCSCWEFLFPPATWTCSEQCPTEGPPLHPFVYVRTGVNNEDCWALFGMGTVQCDRPCCKEAPEGWDGSDPPIQLPPPIQLDPLCNHCIDSGKQ